MSRITLIFCILVLSATAAVAETFSPTPYLAEAEVDVLTKNVANEQFGRDLLGDPYATVVVGNVDVYDRFPYMEARYFQFVSDPGWNRLLMGEVGRAPAAFDGASSAFGRLASPRGLSSDAMGRIYVADTGNDRVLVFQATSEFDRIELEPLFSIDDLARPYDVAFSDGGTPFDPSDDRVYVANTGKNEVRSYELGDNDAHLVAAIGELGSGADYFAGPMSITVGHVEGVHNTHVYVSDAHNGRIVRLQDTGGALAWVGSMQHDLGTITSLDTDHWGSVYAAAPQSGRIAKFTASMLPVASYAGEIKRPRSFHVPFANVTDHRSGEKARAGQGSGILVEEWSGKNGIRLLNLGIELMDATVLDENAAALRVTLTDHATVTATITEPSTGRVIARHDAGVLDAGPQTIRFSDDDYIAPWSAGEYRMVVQAGSTYDANRASETEMTITLSSAGSPPLPEHVTLLGNTPNPFNPTTTIRFTVPAGPSRAYRLQVFDVRGRLVRTLETGQIGSGIYSATWDSRNDNGDTVGSGIYLYRVEVGPEKLTGKMVLVK
jgi:DNA-binding beta-propeller fold protein YncE